MKNSCCLLEESRLSYFRCIRYCWEKLLLSWLLNVTLLMNKSHSCGARRFAEKEDKENELIKEMDRSRPNAAGEKKRVNHELQEEQCRSEKKFKKLEEETKKEEIDHEKKAAELKKQRKDQKAAQRLKQSMEKKATELKQQIELRKQAEMMERFLKRENKNNDSDKQGNESSSKGTTTSSMDCAFSRPESFTIENLHKSQVASWHKLSRCCRSCRWGVRRNPKRVLIDELKLQRSYSKTNPEHIVTSSDKTPQLNCGIMTLNKVVDGSDEAFMLSQNDLGSSVSPPVHLNRKLLQFDKSHRPGYYGTWRKKSGVVGPRKPFKMDPDLDYEVDSDEEWEEEDPGESLSDSDKDSEIEDEDDSQDSFLVPDGYLSENEGVQVDSPSDGINDEPESEEFKLLLRHQRHLHKLTDQALQKERPLFILDLMHEQAGSMMAEDLSSRAKHDQMCLRALCMQPCTNSAVVDISLNHSPLSEDCQSQNKSNTKPTPTAATIMDSDMPEFVRLIESSPHRGFHKIVDSLQSKFPRTPKSHIRNTFREVSEFVDNRWQVKKETLNLFGLSNSPDKSRIPKGITKYFSKKPPPSEGDP